MLLYAQRYNNLKFIPIAIIYIGPGVSSLSIPLVSDSEFAVNSLSANLYSLESL